MERSDTYDVSIDNTDEFNLFNLSTVIDVIRGQLVQIGLKYNANDAQLELLNNILPSVKSGGVFELEEKDVKIRMQWRECGDDYSIHDQIKSNINYVVPSKKGFGILVSNLISNYEQIYSQCASFIGPIVGHDYDKYKTPYYNSETGCFAASPDFGIKIGVFIECIKN